MTINSWLWDFGDGQTSSLRNPSHTYQNPGSYQVKLTVTSALGSNTKTVTNAVNAVTPIMISDSFDKPAGSIYGTAAPVGGSWYAGYLALDLQYQGDGSILPLNPGNSQESDTWNTLQLATDRYYVELDVSIPAQDLDSYVFLYGRVQSAPLPGWASTNSFAEATWMPNGNGTPALYPNRGYASNLTPGRPPAMTGNHTFRLEFTATHVYAKVDGILYWDSPFPNLPLPGWTGFGIRNRTQDGSSPGIRALAFRVGSY